MVILVISLFMGCEEATDTTAPEVTITTPSDGAVLKDTILITALALDNEIVSHVEFYIDGQFSASDSIAPFEYAWVPSANDLGAHTLVCKAVDEAGNETLSDLITITIQSYLVTAIFTQDYLPAYAGTGLLFLSDESGVLLASATWTGNDTILVDHPIMTDPYLGEMSVTTVIMNTVSNVQISTNLAVPSGSIWTFKGAAPVDRSISYDYDLQLTNIPGYDGAILSTPNSSTIWSGGTVGSSISVEDYFPTSSLYLAFHNTALGTEYLWLPNVGNGSLSVDCSTRSTATSHTVNLSEPIGWGRGYLYGYKVGGDYYSGRYTLYQARYPDEGSGSFTFPAPESLMGDFQTYIYYADDDGSYCNQKVYGAIPSSISELNATLEIVTGSPNHFEVTTTGQFDQLRTSWRDTNHNYWSIYGPSGTKSYSLPVLPVEMATLFPVFIPESLELIWVDLVDHDVVDSHAETLEILFETPGRFRDHIKVTRSRYRNYYPAPLKQDLHSQGRAFHVFGDEDPTK